MSYPMFQLEIRHNICNSQFSHHFTVVTLVVQNGIAFVLYLDLHINVFNLIESE